MKYTTIILLILISFSCKLKERVIHTEDKTVYRDSVVYYYPKYDTITNYEKLIIQDNTPSIIKPVIVTGEFSEAVAWVENSLLKLKLYPTVDKFPVPVTIPIRYVTRVEKAEVPAPLPWWVGLSIVVLAIGLVVSLIFKR